MLYWAVLLVKYSTLALEDPSAVRRPHAVRKCASPPRAEWMAPHKYKQPKGFPPKCGSKKQDKSQPPCSFFCTDGRPSISREVWLTADLFDSVPRHGGVVSSGE